LFGAEANIEINSSSLEHFYEKSIKETLMFGDEPYIAKNSFRNKPGEEFKHISKD